MKSSTQLKTELDAANTNVLRLFRLSMSSGKGPSDEYKTAYKNARAIWRQWTDALDMESGRMPERVRVATQFDGEEPATITWGEFAKANADMAPEGLREIAVTIARGEVFHGGGGAAPGYTVRAV